MRILQLIAILPSHFVYNYSRVRDIVQVLDKLFLFGCQFGGGKWSRDFFLFQVVSIVLS